MNENRKCAPLNLKALRKPVCVSILQLRVKANLLYIIKDPKPNIGCLPNHLPNRDQPIKIGDHERSTVFY
jgi:hypothetical protein